MSGSTVASVQAIARFTLPFREISEQVTRRCVRLGLIVFVRYHVPRHSLPSLEQTAGEAFASWVAEHDGWEELLRREVL